MTQPTAHPSASRRTHHLPGADVTVLASGEDTGSQWAVLEYRVAPRFPGTPAHWHAQTTEALYVLDGELSLSLDHVRQRAGPGTFVRVPPGTVHRLCNDTDQPARYLLLVTPAGQENYLAELAELIAHSPAWPPEHPGVVERLTARYDQHPSLEP